MLCIQKNMLNFVNRTQKATFSTSPLREIGLKCFRFTYMNDIRSPF